MSALRQSARRRPQRQSCKAFESRQVPEKVSAEVRPSAEGVKPAIPDVIRAMESLYSDQLKPFGRILRKRVAEHACGIAVEKLYVGPNCAFDPLPEIDMDHLHSVCENCDFITTKSEEGGDWSAVFLERPPVFIDIYSLEDTYSPELWTGAEAYFKGLTGQNMLLPGGRYACAQALRSRKPGFLIDCTLGQVCHIVQLAISPRKILGYCNGAVVPYSHSQSMMKEQCAERQQPCANSGGQGRGDLAEIPLATWELVRTYLIDILKSASKVEGERGMVPLSNIKRLFRSRYHTELSETMLGHSRLSDMLQDERVRDLCTLQLRKSGYVVIQKVTQVGGTPISLAHRLRLDTCKTDNALRLGHTNITEPLCLASCLTAPLPVKEVEPAASTSLGLSMHLPLPGLAMSKAAEGWLCEHSRIQFDLDEPFSLEITQFAGSESSAMFPLPTPLPSPEATVRKWTDRQCRKAFSAEESRVEDARQPTEFSSALPLSLPTPVRSPGRKLSEVPLRIEFSDDELLCLESNGLVEPTPLASPGVPGSATMRRWAGAPRRLEFFPDESLHLIDQNGIADMTMST